MTDLDGLADPVVYTYTWFYVTHDPDSTTCGDGRQIAGRLSIDNETLTIIRHDAGKRICVLVEFQDDAGNEEALESLPTIKIPSGAVIEGEYIDVFGAVQYDITVNTVVGTTLRANTDFVGDYSDLAATPNFTFQWIYWRAGNVGLDGDDGDIPGATSQKYTVQESDAGRHIQVELTFDCVTTFDSCSIGTRTTLANGYSDYVEIPPPSLDADQRRAIRRARGSLCVDSDGHGVWR